jgi:hypothetical protein
MNLKDMLHIHLHLNSENNCTATKILCKQPRLQIQMILSPIETLNPSNKVLITGINKRFMALMSPNFSKVLREKQMQALWCCSSHISAVLKLARP